jgi:probable phosphoglycerate mutase
MKALFVIRHGQSDEHIRGITGGWTDTRLTDLGREQAQRTGLRLRRMLDGRPASLASSDLLRSAETARIIGEICEMEPKLHAELREVNNGDAANLTRARAKQIERPITEPIQDWIAYPRGESWRMMAQRVYGFMELLDPQILDTAIVVTHGNPGVAIIQWWLGLKLPCVPAISFQLDPASISVLSINFWNERTIRKLNDTSHLGEHARLLLGQGRDAQDAG